MLEEKNAHGLNVLTVHASLKEYLLTADFGKLFSS